MRVARRTAHPAVAASPQSAGTATVALVKEEDHPLTATTDQERSFGVVYERLFEKLCEYAVAYRHLSRDDARDVVQDAMYAIWVRYKDGEIDIPGDSFFRQAVRNRIASARRRRYREALRLGEYLREMAWWSRSTDSADEELERKEFKRVFARIVAAMPECCREVWILVREIDLSYDEAAECLGLSVATVKRHMTRAQTLVRTRLTRAGYHDEYRGRQTS